MTTKRKVIHVISDTNIGGAGKILISLLEYFDRSRYDITVILPRGSLLIPELGRIGVPYGEADGIDDRSYSGDAVKQLCALFEELEPDIVHTHAALSARVAARRYGKCAIVHTRHSVFDQPAWKKRFPGRQLCGFINRHYSDRIIAVSPAARDNLTETGTDPDMIDVVFNGVEPAKRLDDGERAAVREKFGLSRGDFVCAIIARLEEVKGHSYVIEAARALEKEYPDIKFIIAGTGSVGEELKKSAAGLSNVIFTGFIKTIYEIENVMDVQLNMSWGTEATSLSLLEGMSLGVPAIVSDFGGNPYVIENGVNGIVVPSRDAGALRDAILRLKAERELYTAMSVAARRIYGERFTAGAMARGVERIYERLIAQKEVKSDD